MANLQSTTITGSLTAGSGVDGNGYLMKATDGSIFRVIDPTATGGISTVNIGAIGTSTGNVRIHATDVLFLSNSGNAERIRVTSGGIKFSSSASSLNYYEQGNWTPQLYAGATAFTMTGINAGKYIRIGNQVTVNGHLNWSGGSGSGMVKIEGLPFASSGVRSAGSIGAVGSGISFDSGYGQWILVNDPTTSFIYIIQQATSGSGYSHNVPVSSSGIIYGFSLTYFIL